VPGLWLITIWAVIVPVIVLENAGVFASFGRSQQLARGNGWHVFGTLVLVFIIMLVVDIILGLTFSALPLALAQGPDAGRSHKRVGCLVLGSRGAVGGTKGMMDMRVLGASGAGVRARRPGHGEGPA